MKSLLKCAKWMRPEEIKGQGIRVDNKDVRYIDKKWIVRGQETSPDRVKYLDGSFWLLHKR